MSLQSLPTSVLRKLLEFIGDAETLCSLDGTCRDVSALVREEAPWTRLLQRTWTHGGNPHAESARQEYKRRYLIDLDVTKCLCRLTRTMEQLPMLYGMQHAMARNIDVVDCCWRLWQHHKSPDTRLFSRGVLRMLLCAVICKEMKTVLNNDDAVDRSPGERLEKAAILTTTLFQNISDETLHDRTAEGIHADLQGIADKIMGEFTSTMSLKEKLEKVDEVFFHREDTRFSGNRENYYDHRNSLMDISLRRRKAIPMTLALLYKFICRRLDILVEVVGLPGHIVVHVPELDHFVDVFDGGRRLTAADCADIVAQYGFPMQQSYLSPLPPEQIVHRILNNQENCLVRNPTIQRPASSRQRAAITALRAVANNPHADQLDQCRHLLVLTWTSEACVGVDISDW